MSKFKIGEIVNINDIINGQVIGFNSLTNQYMIEILEDKDGFLKGTIYGVYEIDLKPIELEKQIELTEVKQALQTKPNNDFIYFKDLNIVVPKKFFEKDILNLKATQLRANDKFVDGFSIFLGFDILQIKQFKTIEQAQEFLKQLQK